MTLMDEPADPPSPAAAERRVRLHHISWPTYVALSDGVGPSVRVAYDRGTMEVVTVSARHEWTKVAVRRVVEAYADAVQVDAEGLG